MDKPEQLVAQRENQRGNQIWANQSNWQHREETKGAIKNGQTRATGNIERKPKGQSKMDKPEQLEIQRENQRGNQKWTNKSNW